MIKRFAIYTACIGGYDEIMQPEFVDDRFDYILFTDDVKEARFGIWQTHHVEYTHKDKTIIARYVKTHPQELLSEYAATLWMDSSLQIVSRFVYERFIELYENGIDVASVKHPKRDCIYDEAYEVSSRKSPGALEYDETALMWCHKLWKEGYPQHNGLIETSILFRRNNEAVSKVNESWWNCIIQYSKRDQLSFNYVIWQIKPSVECFLKDGEHMMNSDKVKYLGHSKVSTRKALKLSDSQQQRYLFRVRSRRVAMKQWFAFMKKSQPVRWLHTIGTLTAKCYLLGAKQYDMLRKIKWKFVNFLHEARCGRMAAYGKWLEDLHRDKSHFVPFTERPYERREGDAKIFAYYLTQYHAIPENDDAHGKGFTEWTNVASAPPQFVGHYQPKIPYDVGFYNLLMPGVMERQVEIAKAYGIYGFCFYYYWFSGKKVLEKPLEYWLVHKEIDFHYHFCWANEHWSKLWDGGNQELILKQELKDEDAERFFDDMLPYFKDSRYEKIDNKPILMIYRPSLFPRDRFLLFVDKLQQLARENGFDGLFLTISNRNYADEDMDPTHYGENFAQSEFPPHEMYKLCKQLNYDRLIPNTDFAILDTSEFINKKLYLEEKPYKVFKCCFPSWDNTSRKAWSGGLCFMLSDEQFAIWLSDILRWTQKNHSEDEQYVYINAWNEWAEGAILEPTLRYGYKKLSIVKQCIEKVRKE